MTSSQTRMNLSTARRELLARLDAAGGSLAGRVLSVPARGLASKMSLDRLVSWARPRPLGRKTTGLNEWTLSITDAGRAALKEADQ